MATTARPRMLSQTETARRLGISRRRVRAAVLAGDLPAYHLGGQWAIPAAAVRRMIEGKPLKAA